MMNYTKPDQSLPGRKEAIDRVRHICRFAKPGDQIPLPWDIWEDYSRALNPAHAPLLPEHGEGHPLRLIVDTPKPKEAPPEGKIVLPGASAAKDKSKLPVTVFPVIK